MCAELLWKSLAPDSSAEGDSESLLVVSGLAEKRSGERKGTGERSCLLLLVPAAHSIKYANLFREAVYGAGRYGRGRRKYTAVSGTLL